MPPLEEGGLRPQSRAGQADRDKRQDRCRAIWQGSWRTERLPS